MRNYYHIHSMYSLFDSTSEPEDIVKKCKELDLKNIVLNDHDSLLGIESFMDAGKKYGINTIPGIEISMPEHLILIAKNYKGYQEISAALKEANKNIKKIGKHINKPIFSKDILTKYFKNSNNIIATSACIQGTISQILLTNKERFKKELAELKKLETTNEEFILYNEYNQKYLAAKEISSTLEKKRKLYEKTLSKENKEKILKDNEKLKELKVKQASLDEEKKKYENLQKKREKIENSIRENLALIQEAKSNYNQVISILEKKNEEKIEFKKRRDKFKNASKKQEDINRKLIELKPIDQATLYEQAKEELVFYKSIFKDFYIELQYHGMDEEAYVMPILLKMAKETDTSWLIANDAHLIDNSNESIEARRLIRYNYFEKPQEISEFDKELYIKSKDELKAILSQIIDEEDINIGIDNLSILEDCKVDFPNEKHYPCAEGVDFDTEIEKARQELINKGIWSEEYQQRLDYEVEVIKKMGFVDYHMNVYVISKISRLLGKIPKDRLAEIPDDFNEIEEWLSTQNYHSGIGIGDGRGSAAGSLVCYMLHITNVNPLTYDLIFDRYLNPERVTMPDVDSDIKTSLRPTIIKYLQWKYGIDAVCSIATVTTFAPKGAIQFAGREMKDRLYPNKESFESKDFMNRYLKMSDVIPEDDPKASFKKYEKNIIELYGNDKQMMEVLHNAIMLENKIKGTGVHAGGVVISDNSNINEYVPLAYNDNKNVWVAQCDMVRLEEKGLLKMDLLGLNTLDCISDCMQLVEKYRGIIIDLDDIPFEDCIFEGIYSKGLTNSVFQFESAGMKNMLTRFRPNCIEDLIILVSMYRPGPMQYLDDVIAVKRGEKEVTYICDDLKPILSKTYGAIVYQEQVMKIFQDLAGYTLGGADTVRRYMSKKKEDKLAQEREAFINGDYARGIAGCKAKGISEDVANALFDQMMDFASYAFNKSHAAAYAILSYKTAYLKYHYPIEFMCAMFNNSESEDYAILVDDCREFGIKVLPPCINHSAYDFSIEGNAIRYGFKGIKGLGDANREELINISNKRKYNDFSDFICKNMSADDTGLVTGFPKKGLIEILIKAGCFDSLHKNREDLYKKWTSLYTENFKKLSLKTVKGIIEDMSISTLPCNKQFIYEMELDLLNNVISEDPLEQYQDDEIYECVPINQLNNDKGCSIYGFALKSENIVNKKGNKEIIVDLLGKMGKCKIHIQGKLYETFSNKLYEINNHVLKFKGNAYGSIHFYASDIQSLNAIVPEYLIELNDLTSHNLVNSILKKSSKGSTIIHVQYSYDEHEKRLIFPHWKKISINDDTLHEIEEHNINLKQYQTFKI